MNLEETNEELKNKAIDLKGKKYILVADRVLAFNELYSNGCIQTQLISEPQDKLTVVKAKIIPDSSKPERFFTGYSQAMLGGNGANREAAMENAETSAVGRGLAMMGIGVLESIASADEVNKATAEPRTVVALTSAPTKFCETHNIEVEQRTSNKTGKPYYGHMVDGKMCFIH